MNESSLAVRLDERYDRRCKERRAFSYTAFLPDRRELPDRRCRISPHLVELEDEEIASLLESPIE